MARTKSGQTWYGLDQIRSNSARWPEGLEKTAFFDSFWQFFVLFFAFSPKIYITKRYSEKKLGLSCFFLWQEPLIQKSAAPQGSPPPTQQISEIQLSWAINYNKTLPRMICFKILFIFSMCSFGDWYDSTLKRIFLFSWTTNQFTNLNLQFFSVNKRLLHHVEERHFR